MEIPKIDYNRYLEAKYTVDSASLNPRVFNHFQKALESRDAVRILDLGTGTGAMLQRLLAFDFHDAHLFGIDTEQSRLDAARERVTGFLQSAGWQISFSSDILEARWRERSIRVSLVRAEVGRDLQSRFDGLFDCVTALSFMDLVPLGPTLEVLGQLLKPGGLIYAALNYDGRTSVLPAWDDPVFEQVLLEGYDLSMDNRRVRGMPTGGSRCGSKLIGALGDAGFSLRDAGSSDWSVFSTGQSNNEPERILIEAILSFIAKEGLAGDPAGSHRLNPERTTMWYRDRLSDLQNRQLTLIVHQLDILASTAAEG